jgi:aspartate/methionine/tyrosine aminotransferase
MKYVRMAIERESPEEIGYGLIANNLSESSIRDHTLSELDIGICGSVVDETIAARVLGRRQSLMAETSARIKRRLGIMREWIAGEPLVEWVKPAGGVVALPHLNGLVGRNMGGFHRRLLADYGTYVGPGHWFGMPPHVIRIGFDWPTEAELHNGLAGISKAMRAELAAS